MLEHPGEEGHGIDVKRVSVFAFMQQYFPLLSIVSDSEGCKNWLRSGFLREAAKWSQKNANVGAATTAHFAITHQALAQSDYLNDVQYTRRTKNENAHTLFNALRTPW